MHLDPDIDLRTPKIRIECGSGPETLEEREKNLWFNGVSRIQIQIGNCFLDRDPGDQKFAIKLRTFENFFTAMSLLCRGLEA